MKQCVLVAIFLLVFTAQPQATLFFTGDLDLRYKNIDFNKNEFELYVAGISLRKVFADKMGDRIILFLLAETMHNFDETMIDQGYFQYKGPLGKWNIILGRYRLPYGLLSNYSTERLLITTVENETIGFSSDNGLQLSGTIKNFDYAISLSQGVGQVFRQIDIDNNGMISFRVGYQGIDFEDFRIGLSGLIGKIIQEAPNDVLNKKLLGVDIIKYSGPLVFRSEFSLGKEAEKNLLGVFSGIDYAMLSKIDLNTGYALVKNDENKKRHSLNIGLTYNIFPGFQIRIAKKIPVRIKEEVDELSIQAYYVFNRTF